MSATVIRCLALPTAKDFVATLATEHHLDAHRFNLATQQIHGRTCTHGCHVVRLEMVNYVGDRVVALLQSERELEMGRVQKLCDFTSRQKIRRVKESDAEGVQLREARKTFCRIDRWSVVIRSYTFVPIHLLMSTVFPTRF